LESSTTAGWPMRSSAALLAAKASVVSVEFGRDTAWGVIAYIRGSQRTGRTMKTDRKCRLLLGAAEDETARRSGSMVRGSSALL
jgi:hypothetical protein